MKHNDSQYVHFQLFIYAVKHNDSQYVHFQLFIYAVKHNNSQYVHFQLFGGGGVWGGGSKKVKKKKSRPTYKEALLDNDKEPQTLLLNKIVPIEVPAFILPLFFVQELVFLACLC